MTLLDGMVGGPWWYSIGYTQNYNNGTDEGQPAYVDDNGIDGKVAGKTQLFIYVGGPAESGKILVYY